MKGNYQDTVHTLRNKQDNLSHRSASSLQVWQPCYSAQKSQENAKRVAGHLETLCSR